MESAADDRFLAEAIALARENSRDGESGPFGAVVVKDGVVVGRGANRVTAEHDPSAHAEILALRQAGRTLGSHDLGGCTLYSSCEPCPMCLGALLWARIDRVVYAADRQDAARAGFDDAAFYREVRLEWPERRLRSEQRQRDEGRAVLERWQGLAQKQAY